MTPIRLIVDSPQTGDWNMAVDEALLHSAAKGITTLRFYEWSVPTLSLGYFQEYADREQHAASRECACVRRTSGGGAILHDQELTYSFASPITECRGSGSMRLYGLFHEALIQTLSTWGVCAQLCFPAMRAAIPPPFLCFQRRAAGDVLVGEAKVCGSAQRRHRGALLQHGSIILQQSHFAPEIQGILQIAGRGPSCRELADTWRKRVVVNLGRTSVESQLSAEEHELAEQFRVRRFGADAWLTRR